MASVNDNDVTVLSLPEGTTDWTQVKPIVSSVTADWSQAKPIVCEVTWKAVKQEVPEGFTSSGCDLLEIKKETYFFGNVLQQLPEQQKAVKEEEEHHGCDRECHEGALDGKKFQCGYCSKTFDKSKQLGKHRQIHTKPKKAECELCNKMFSRREHLRRHHITQHTSERRFSCDVCNKLFARKDHLQKHIYTHTAEKPCVCEVCGKGFPSLIPLRTHQKTHLKDSLISMEAHEKAMLLQQSPNKVDEPVTSSEAIKKDEPMFSKSMASMLSEEEKQDLLQRNAMVHRISL